MMIKKTLKISIFIFAFHLNGFSFGEVDSYAPPIEVMAEKIENIGKLEIAIPSDWDVTKLPGNTLRAMDSRVIGGYKRNFVVKPFSGKRYIDDITGKYFRDLVNDKYKTHLRSVQNYDTVEPEYVTLENGQEALLLYSTFSLEGEEMMHMHLILSGDDQHFLVTYTDFHRNLSGDNSESFQMAWSIMSKLSVPYTEGVGRHEQTIYAAVIAGSFVLSLVLFFYIRRRLSASSIGSFDAEEADEIDDELDKDDEWVVEGQGKRIRNIDELDEFDEEFDRPA